MGVGLATRAKLIPLWALTALIGLAGVGVLITQPSTATSPAVLEVVEPSAEVRAEGQADFSAARSGDSVSQGAVIRTDRTGAAAIAYADGSLTRIGPATTYELVTLRTEDGRRQIIGKLDTGQTFHRVSKVTGSSSRFEVQTSDAVAAVRGTEFAVQCLVLDICEFGVTEGIVSVRADDGREVEVTAGHRVTVDGDGRLGELKPLSGTDPWIALNIADTQPGGAAPDADSSDEPTPTAASSGPRGDARFRSWGGFSAARSGTDSESAAAEPADEDTAQRDGESARREENATPTAASAASTETTNPSETTSTTSEPTTTTAAPETTTTTTTAESTTSTTSADRTTTTRAGGDPTTTTSPSGGESTTTSTTSNDSDSTTSTTSGGGGGTTTTTTGGTTTTPTSSPTTTTTGPCPEGEEPVEGRGCRPKCPHDRPRDPNGNCQRECPPGDPSEQCPSAARAGSQSSSKETTPLLWIFSFLFGGTVLARRAPDRWDN